MRQRSLYGVWRMTTVYRSPPDDSIVIVSVARHIDGANLNATLAAIFPACPTSADADPSSHRAATILKHHSRGRG